MTKHYKTRNTLGARLICSPMRLHLTNNCERLRHAHEEAVMRRG